MVNSNQVTTQIITPIPNTTPSTTEWSTKLYDTEIFGIETGMCVYVSTYLAESWIFFRVSEIRICENDKTTYYFSNTFLDFYESVFS